MQGGSLNGATTMRMATATATVTRHHPMRKSLRMKRRSTMKMTKKNTTARTKRYAVYKFHFSSLSGKVSLLMHWGQDTMTEEQRMEEGRRMFQIFAARMFEQRVLTAYREK